MYVILSTFIQVPINLRLQITSTSKMADAQNIILKTPKNLEDGIVYLLVCCLVSVQCTVYSTMYSKFILKHYYVVTKVTTIQSTFSTFVNAIRTLDRIGTFFIFIKHRFENGDQLDHRINNKLFAHIINILYPLRTELSKVDLRYYRRRQSQYNDILIKYGNPVGLVYISANPTTKNTTKKYKSTTETRLLDTYTNFNYSKIYYVVLAGYYLIIIAKKKTIQQLIRNLIINFQVF